MKTNKLTVLTIIGACLLFFTCEKNLQNPRTHRDVKEKTAIEQPKPKVAWPDGTEVFYLLRNQRLTPAQIQPPENFYIKGLIEKGQFVPKTGVLGTGELAEDGRHGWFELNEQKFVPMETPREPRKPYINGVMTRAGFIPSDTIVYTETGPIK